MTRPGCRPLSCEELRSLDVSAADEFALSTLVLMENAGRGAAERWAAMAGSGRRPSVLVVCGPGNNGGDGGVMARHLDAWGYPVSLVWFARLDAIRGDARAQWDVLERSEVPQQDWFDARSERDEPDPAALDELFAGADWLVDGLLGTGLARPVEGAFRAVVEAMNRSGKPILALDVPSGLDADSGEPMGVAVRARATITFAARKIGFDAPGASIYTGDVAVVDIGLPGKLLQRFRAEPPM
ncbi:NAD(P)H-hydrate epimerase [Planctomyces sp. SH-PL62]|uniref:NAD(P)H-hydrate epimerase n=1 Tax=Planctomyces sp. SH-PL62 TaxID=1636152 RepID=UPI00078CBC39|nr:NAD(P)H-hydrate epimerase [Planctomyces sp. SH-PL62]AMV40843.1 Bifunctional NAD(P)H-hydrate repair enzyme Nnr [Planctomyces sp. SH-PL62]